MTTPPRSCEPYREAVSARLDDELGPVPSAELDAHLAACATCADFLVAVTALGRRTRVAAAPAVPDLTAAILAAVPPVEPMIDRTRQLRGVLALAGVVQLVIAATTLLPALGSGLHATRELGIFELALGIGFLVVARLPHLAAGLLPVVGVVAVVGVASGIGDVAAGLTSPVTELAAHAAELVGAATLVALLRSSGVRPVAVVAPNP